MPEKEIELDDETSLEILNLAKEIKGLESQNRFMTGLHMFLVLFCLTILLFLWTDDTTNTLIITISVVAVELIDTTTFKIITNKNIQAKIETQAKIREIIDKNANKGKILDILIDDDFSSKK